MGEVGAMRHRLERALWVAIGAGIAVRLAIPWLSRSLLLEYFISDDAFYYFVIARNAVTGGGITFDGMTPTNGFHPLWLIFLLPVYAIAGGDADLALRLSLELAAVLGAGAVVLLGVAVREWTGDSTAGWLASALLALNPYAVLESVNGLETSLALVMLTLTLIGLRRGWLWLGLAGGALVWARSDMAAVLVALYAYLACSRRATVRRLVPAAAVTAGMVALWLVWSWATVGTPVQSSAVAIPWLVRARMNDAIAGGWLTRAQVAARLWSHFVQTTLYQMLNYAGVGLVAGLVGWIVRLARRRRFPGRRPPVPGWVWWGGAATLATVLVGEFARFSVREWYLAPLSLWGAAFGAGMLAGWASAPRLRRWLAVACVALLLLSAGHAARTFAGHGRYWFQEDQVAAARWIAANTPEDAVVGSWTAGIYGYYAQRRVVNLDGVVNWDAIRAYRARDLYAYMREEGIGWVVDFDEFVTDFTLFFGADPGRFLTPAKVFEEADAPFGRLVVYEVES